MTGHVLFVVYSILQLPAMGHQSSKTTSILYTYATPNALVSYQEKFNIPKAVGHPVAL